MAFVRKFSLNLVFAFAVALTTAFAESEPAKAPAGEKDKPAEKQESKSSEADDFQIPVPPGVPVKGIRIPQYNEDGKQIMLFDAEVARKIDDENLEMENLKIEAVGEDDRKFYIDLPKSVFNLQSRILNGTNRISIRRDDFEITGQSGEFHTKTRFAKVIGDVKMIIFNTENLD